MTMLSPVARIQYSQRSLLLAALSAEAARLLGSHLRETELREGALLWDAGPDAGRIFFPISGIISVRVPTGTGHGIEVATIGPEAAAGFHDGWARVLVLTRAVVHSSGRFGIISVEAFHAAAGECEEPGRLAAACKGWMLAQSQRTAACNAAHSADARFCRWLLRTSDALGLDVVRVDPGGDCRGAWNSPDHGKPHRAAAPIQGYDHLRPRQDCDPRPRRPRIGRLRLLFRARPQSLAVRTAPNRRAACKD
jgi:hypothetical protein